MSWLENVCAWAQSIGGGAYWARAPFGSCGPPLSLARPLFWVMWTFSSYILPLWLVKIFSNEQEMRTKRAQNAANGGLDSPKLVCWPGSARTHCGSLQLSPRSLAGFRGEGRDGREGWGGERRDRPVHFLVASAAYLHKGTHAQKDRQAENIVPQSHP